MTAIQYSILIVEDDRHLQKILSDLLKEKGYSVLNAFDGEEALNILVSHTPHLILLDLILPKKDGFEVLKTIKDNYKTKNIPVIVLTNLEGSADIEKALELGAETYLVKANYKLEEILDKIKKVIK